MSTKATKQWLGYFTVTTPAGKFNCAAISSGGMIEYYSNKGLVKSTEIVECFIPPCPDPSEKLIYVNF